MIVPMNEELKDLRKFLKQSQSQFAQTLGVSVDTVRRWEQQKATPSHMALEKIATLVKRVKKERNDSNGGTL
jgi:DNA-binding transcriptional regulator YiaG